MHRTQAGTICAGILVLTTHRVFYRPAFVARICGDRSFEVRNREVTDVGLKSLEQHGPLAAKKVCVRLVLVGDREELIVVDNPMGCARAILEGDRSHRRLIRRNHNHRC